MGQEQQRVLELVEEFRSFCREMECFGGEYWDQDFEASDEWADEHVPEELRDAFWEAANYY